MSSKILGFCQTFTQLRKLTSIWAIACNSVDSFLLVPRRKVPKLSASSLVAVLPRFSDARVCKLCLQRRESPLSPAVIAFAAVRTISSGELDGKYAKCLRIQDRNFRCSLIFCSVFPPPIPPSIWNCGSTPGRSIILDYNFYLSSTGM